MSDLYVASWVCPFIVEGEMTGHKVFFRSRGGQWRLEIDDEVVDRGSESLSEEELLDGETTWTLEKVQELVARHLA